MTFGEMVKEVRGQLQLTQKELAAELDVGYYTVNRWEQGHNEPTFLVRRRFENFCKQKGIVFSDKE